MGGILLDGSGDIAVTSSIQEELQTMVATRLKASINSWQLYQIGANLDSYRGSSIGINNNVELSIQKQVTSDLTNQLLPPGSFTVSTIPFGNQIQVLVYLGSTLIASSSVVTS
jgi:hypothetical protein